MAVSSDISIMHSGRITEQDENSLELDENTVIQVYNGLDSTNSLQSGSAEDEEVSLSHSHHHRMELMEMEKHQERPQQRQVRPRHRRDIESKYDLDVSPSTKEEQSLLNQYSSNFLKQHTQRPPK